MSPVEVTRGTSPVILGFPHAGTFVPPLIWEQLSDNGRRLADTDWHIDTLYAGLLPNATTVRASFHRYVIDANRNPAGESLYPGQNTTTLIPLTDFEGAPIWRRGQEPTAGAVPGRLAEFHAPYHAALAAEVARVHFIHGVAIVYDCHSIRSRIAYLFDGTLPDFNVGTNDGRTCSREIAEAVLRVVRAAGDFTSVLNGRFKGGWTTRHYGDPEAGIHAVQLELAQSTYLTSEAPPFADDPAKVAKLRVPLRTILERLEQVVLRA